MFATKRLQAERTAWRKEHPHAFFAKPEMQADGTMNIMRWKCGIPGPKGSLWEGAVYPVVLEFPAEFPDLPPRVCGSCCCCSAWSYSLVSQVRFPAGFFHPNVYPSGTVCLSLVDAEKDWKSAITVKQILLGVQDLLNNPNPKSPAQEDAYRVYIQDRPSYEKRVKQQALLYSKQTAH